MLVPSIKLNSVEVIKLKVYPGRLNNNSFLQQIPNMKFWFFVVIVLATNLSVFSVRPHLQCYSCKPSDSWYDCKSRQKLTNCPKTADNCARVIFTFFIKGIRKDLYNKACVPFANCLDTRPLCHNATLCSVKCCTTNVCNTGVTRELSCLSLLLCIPVLLATFYNS